MFMSQEKLQTISMQNFWGVKEVHYGIVQVLNLDLPSLHGDLLCASPGAPSSAPFWTLTMAILTVLGGHFSSLKYRFYGAWWLRVFSWRCFSGFMLREICVPRAWRVYLATGFDFCKKNPVFVLGRSESEFAVRSLPTLPLYYGGKMKKTIFSQSFVYVLRTTRTRQMISFIDLNFHFLANFQT